MHPIPPLWRDFYPPNGKPFQVPRPSRAAPDLAPGQAKSIYLADCSGHRAPFLGKIAHSRGSHDPDQPPPQEP